MPDTARTKSALATLFANNTTEAISAQDLRDFLETMHPSFGSQYVSSALATTISVADTWYKAAGTTTDVNLHRFDGKTALSVDNRLKYTGTPDIHVHGVVSFSASIATGTNKTLQFAAYHYDDSGASGSILTHSAMTRFASSTAIGTGAIHFDVMLSTNDYIEFWVKNVTDTTNITMNNYYTFMLGMMV